MKKQQDYAVIKVRVKGEVVKLSAKGDINKQIAALVGALAEIMHNARKDEVTNEEIVQAIASYLRMMLWKIAPEKEAEHGAE